MVLLCLLIPGAYARGDTGMASPPVPVTYIACISCHGSDGWGSPAIHAPPIAGQPANYTRQQLLHFRNGRRGQHVGDTWGAQMALMAAPLSDSEIDALAAYLAAQPAWPLPKLSESAASDGYQICQACHGSDGGDVAETGVPRIAGLPADYLFRQLLAYRSGRRPPVAGSGQPSPMEGVITDRHTDSTLRAWANYLSGSGVGQGN